ncbi:MAG: response regulator [Deltaproteobacteria bacterium]|nr:response regulator [Deltaproteobacteria bacterium]
MNGRQEKKNERKSLILIVDDVPMNLQVLGNILSQENYQIAVATNGRQALSLTENVTPDLILLDVVMPEVDGFEVCRILKSDDRTADIPIIFLTAKSESEDIVKGFELGAVDYLTKPFSTPELLARVRTHLELKKSKDLQNELIARLKDALTQVKQLTGLIPICSHCKRIRDDAGYWQQVEAYIARYSEAQFSHSICPECLDTYYPEFADKVKKRDEKTEKTTPS